MLEDLPSSLNPTGALGSRPSVDSTCYPYRGLSIDLIDYKTERNKHPHVGICMNNLCSSRPRHLSKVKYAKYTKGFTTRDKKLVDCPTCKTALYWTNNWNERWAY